MFVREPSVIYRSFAELEGEKDAAVSEVTYFTWLSVYHLPPMVPAAS